MNLDCSQISHCHFYNLVGCLITHAFIPDAEFPSTPPPCFLDSSSLSQTISSTTYSTREQSHILFDAHSFLPFLGSCNENRRLKLYRFPSSLECPWIMTFWLRQPIHIANTKFPASCGERIEKKDGQKVGYGPHQRTQNPKGTLVQDLCGS